MTKEISDSGKAGEENKTQFLPLLNINMKLYFENELPFTDIKLVSSLSVA